VDSEKRRRKFPGAVRAAAAGLLCASIAGAQFAGSAVCRNCHAEPYKQQSASAHAHALSKPAAHRLASSFSGVKADWAFGAGGQAVTFVSRVDAESYLEHHLSYYPLSKVMAATPGHEGGREPGVLYRTFDPSTAILRCFQCHSTGRVGVDDTNTIQPVEAGVRCEVCHGPGTEHAKAPRAANILNPSRYTAAEMNQFCGSCHRKPAASGDDTDWRNAWNTRHQPLYLAESACFQKSAGKLSCLSCHDAHTGAARDACSSCHAGVRHRAALRVASRKCTECHMPAVRPTAHLRFTNHWIGVYASGDSLMPRASGARIPPRPPPRK
jgi:hypothetical protein